MQTELPATPAAGRLAREALDGWLGAIVGEPTAEQVRLAATELVTNAVRHGGLGRTDTIVLSCVTMDDVVRVGVEQASSAARAHLVPSEERSPSGGGFGLRIVDGLSCRWGVDDGPPGRVWCEVDTAPRSSA